LHLDETIEPKFGIKGCAGKEAKLSGCARRMGDAYYCLVIKRIQPSVYRFNP